MPAPGRRNARSAPQFANKFGTNHNQRRFHPSLRRLVLRSFRFLGPALTHSKAARKPDRRLVRPDERSGREETFPFRRGQSSLHDDRCQSVLRLSAPNPIHLGLLSLLNTTSTFSTGGPF